MKSSRSVGSILTLSERSSFHGRAPSRQWRVFAICWRKIGSPADPVPKAPASHMPRGFFISDMAYSIPSSLRSIRTTGTRSRPANADRGNVAALRCAEEAFLPMPKYFLPAAGTLRVRGSFVSFHCSCCPH